jgi:hypothetical protein
LDSSIIQGPFSVAPCRTLISRFATFSSQYTGGRSPVRRLVAAQLLGGGSQLRHLVLNVAAQLLGGGSQLRHLVLNVAAQLLGGGSQLRHLVLNVAALRRHGRQQLQIGQCGGQEPAGPPTSGALQHRLDVLYPRGVYLEAGEAESDGWHENRQRWRLIPGVRGQTR